MEEKRRKDIIRCTLQSYLGKSIKDLTLGEQQKTAVVRLTGMRNERFDQLCDDLINEIHRRNGLDFNNPTVLGEKLFIISDQKFKNLVMETLTVFYFKNPNYQAENMPEFIEKVKILIKDLKEQTEKEIFINQIENLGFYSKIYEFLDFVKRSGIDGEITTIMKEFVDQKVEEDGFDFFELLEFPDLFLKRFFENEKKMKNENFYEKIKNLYNEVLQLSNGTSKNYNEKSEILKNNITEIISVVIQNVSIPSKKIEFFENEISGVVEVLEEVEKEIETKMSMNLDNASLKLSEILENIISKGSNLTNEHINELKIQQVSVELINNKQSRNESFKLVLEIAKDIRKALSSI